MGQHPSASGSVLLGLDGFEVLAAQVAAGEWQLEIQTTATMVGCQGCGGAGRAPWPPQGPGAGPADRWPSGGAGLAQADLALC